MKIPGHIPDEQVERYLKKTLELPYRLHPGCLQIDCEMGFVTSIRKDTAFCRYWDKHNSLALRTTSCSESTSIDRLLVLDTRPQSEVDDWIGRIEREEKI